MWDIEPKVVVAQLFRPSERVPSNAAEAFFLALSDRDALGAWYACALPVAAVAAPVAAAAAAWLAAGHEDAAAALYVSGALLAAGLVTQVIKFSTAMYGRSNGGRF
jgi:hypothetical protein